MKTHSLVVALVATSVVVSAAVAQVSFSLGPKLGVNLSSLSYDPDLTLPPGVTKSGQTNLMFGAAAEIGFAKMFAVQFEPTYNQKGDKFEQGSAKQTNTATFFEIPVLFKVNFIDGPVKPYAFVGPSIGITLSSKTKQEGFGPGFDGEIDNKDSTSSTDFAIAFGGGAEFKVAPKVGITGDVRYSLGLSNLNTAQGGVPSIKTRGFQILIGALFYL